MTLPIPLPTAAAPAAAPAGTRVSPAGIGASVLASIAFAAVFVVPGSLVGIDAFGALGWRIIAALPFVALILTTLRQWGEFADILRRVRRAPALALVLVVDGLLLGVQMFLFAWAPMHGQALAASFGYFVLPLAIVAVGIIVLRERVNRMRVAAIALATVGVVVAIVAGASISWATLVVVAGYPGYFLLRRRFRLDTPAALSLEMLVLLPVSVWFVLQPGNLAALTGTPANVLPVLALGLLTAVGFSAFTIAQRRLSFTVFGLLAYLEPLLLVVGSVVLLQEQLGVADLVSYAAIIAGIAVLTLDGVPERLAARRTARKSARKSARRLARREHTPARASVRPRWRAGRAAARAARSTPSRAPQSESATSRTP